MKNYQNIPAEVLVNTPEMINSKKDLMGLRLFTAELARTMRKNQREYLATRAGKSLCKDLYEGSKSDYVTARLCLRNASVSMDRKNHELQGEIKAKEFLDEIVRAGEVGF